MTATATAIRRYVVLGAGAIGGGVGGLLAVAGHPVHLVARGAHLDALQTRGLHLRTVDAEGTLKLPASAAYSPKPGDVVLLAVKVQDTAEAMARVPIQTPVVSLQNGVEGARWLAARGHPTLGGMVYVPATHLVPGQVDLHGTPVPGRVDVGAWPRGTHALAEPIALALRQAGFRSQARDDIDRWIHAKLLTNLAGVVQAVCGRIEADDAVVAAAQDEGRACYAAAGIDAVTLPYLISRVGALEVGEVAGTARPGGSTWQSLARGRPLESAHLNGEVVALGQTHGVPTPVNAALVRIAAQASAQSWRPGHWTPSQLAQAVHAGSGPA